MNLYKSLENFSRRSQRFFKSCRLVGLRNALKLFFLDKYGSSPYYKLKIRGLPNATFIRTATSDGGTFSSIFVDGSYPHFPGYEAKTIIDAGANAGYASLFFAVEYPNAEIIAIEPESSNIEIIKKNTHFLPQIQVLQGALWNSNEKLNLLNGNSKDTFQVMQNINESDSEIAGYTVNDIIKAKSWQNIDILKIDIEGAEKEVFEGEQGSWLKLVKILIIELHEDYSPGCGDAFARAVAGHGFQFYRRGENYILIRRELGLKVLP